MHKLRDQSGAILLLGALLLFSLMGIAALTVDIGMGLLARLSMQSAADSAALEGLQRRDLGVDDPGLTAADRDAARRAAAQALVRLGFDDDLIVGGDAMNFGAGSQFDLTGGVGDVNAFQTLARGEPPVYKPFLQLNQTDNAAHGDMVAGQFNPGNAAPIPVANERFDGAGSFLRDDFAAAAVAAAPVADGFLVRLRRSRDQYGIENQSGVSSAGPALPFLFARGGTMTGGDPSTGYSPRHDGFNVRSAAVAATRRAVAVGLPLALTDPVVSVAGVAPFALSRDFWDGLAADAPITVSVQPDGAVLGSGVAVGRVAVDVNTIGQPVILTSPTAGAAPENSYVPIFELIEGADRVVGFGALSAIGSLPGAVTLTKRPSRVAPVNASANFLVTLPPLNAVAWPLILAAHNAFTEPLLAAALAR